MWNAAFRRQENAGQFRAQILASVVDVAEAIGIRQRGTVEAALVASPMGQFVKGRPVVARSVFERIPRRQVDAVRTRAVERLVRLVVNDSRSRVCQDAFTGLSGFAGAVLTRRIGGNAVDPLRVKKGVDAPNQLRLVFCHSAAVTL